MIDGAYISLPESPISLLLRLHQVTKSTEITTLNERWGMTAENQQYLRKIIASSTRKSNTPRSERELTVAEGRLIYHSRSGVVIEVV